jgi:hypothetical protein
MLPTTFNAPELSLDEASMNDRIGTPSTAQVVTQQRLLDAPGAYKFG